jgi:glutamine synthetase
MERQMSDAETYLVDGVSDGTIGEVEIAWTDQFGHAAGKRIPGRDFLDRARREGFAFSIAALGWNSAAEVQEDLLLATWDSGFEDVHAVPDFSTARPLPWRDGVAHVTADIRDAAGELVLGHPRALLRSVIDRLAQSGIEAKVGIETEFYLLNPDGTPFQKRIEAYSLENANSYGPLFDDLSATLARFVRLEGVETEYGPGQVEVNLRYTDPLTAADDAARLKYAAKEVARRHGKVATFMAKPLGGESGSSAHVHVSLWRGGEPLFAPVDGTESVDARFAIAGLLAHLPALTLLGGHTVNAFKRYEPGSWAPSTVTWSGDNRSAAVRSLRLGPESSRLELRTGSSEANPYWLVAGVLAALASGLEAGLEPPPPAQGNAYLVGEPLPKDLKAAIDAFRADGELAKRLDPQATEDFARIAESEWNAYTTQVTDWEVRRYLHTS